MKTIIKIFSFFCCLALFQGCSNTVDFGEQYKKTVYIVNATQYTGEHFFEAPDDYIEISVYCASSKPITEDLTVRLMLDPNVLEEQNVLNELSNTQYIRRIQLPSSTFQLPAEPLVTIKAGAQYGTLKIPFNFGSLDPDIYYVLPLYLSANSKGYDITPELRSIAYEIKMVNDYSGSFSGSSTEMPQTETERMVVKTVQPTLKALSKNTVRLAIHDADASDDTKLMVLTVAADGSVNISPWNNSDVTDLGGSRYNAVKMQYELNYRYNGKIISEVLTNILAPKTDDDLY